MHGPGKMAPVATDDGTDNGKLTEVKQFYTLKGTTTEHPMYTVYARQHNTISDGAHRPRQGN